MATLGGAGEGMTDFDVRARKLQEANDEVMARSPAVEGGADLRVEHDLGSLSLGKRQRGANTDGDVHAGVSPRQSLKDPPPPSLAMISGQAVIHMSSALFFSPVGGGDWGTVYSRCWYCILVRRCFSFHRRPSFHLPYFLVPFYIVLLSFLVFHNRSLPFPVILKIGSVCESSRGVMVRPART